jgi:hypothetical protein
MMKMDATVSTTSGSPDAPPADPCDYRQKCEKRTLSVSVDQLQMIQQATIKVSALGQCKVPMVTLLDANDRGGVGSIQICDNETVIVTAEPPGKLDSPWLTGPAGLSSNGLLCLMGIGHEPDGTCSFSFSDLYTLTGGPFHVVVHGKKP